MAATVLMSSEPRPRAQAHRDSGQAVIETAIVLPLYVFLILGILQLGLMQQARLLTKYAAYKAVRTGALNRARVDLMEREALAVMLPLISKAKHGGAEWIASVTGSSPYLEKWRWQEVRENRMAEADLKLVEITICGPLQRDLPAGAKEIDFDDPSVAGVAGWRESQRTKLRVQATFNYRMPIPFVNYVIHRTAWGVQLSPGHQWVLRTGKAPSREPPGWSKEHSKSQYQALADQQVYVLPIRATYTMRMQSNLPPAGELPQVNLCFFPFDTR